MGKMRIITKENSAYFLAGSAGMMIALNGAIAGYYFSSFFTDNTSLKIVGATSAVILSMASFFYSTYRLINITLVRFVNETTSKSLV